MHSSCHLVLNVGFPLYCIIRNPKWNKENRRTATNFDSSPLKTPYFCTFLAAIKITIACTQLRIIEAFKETAQNFSSIYMGKNSCFKTVNRS